MAQFRYRAINAEGRMITGTHTSASERELETLLSKLKLELVSCSEHKPLFYLGYAKKVSRRDLINYCFLS